MLGFMLRAPRVDAEVLCAAVATYLLLGLIWAFAYSMAAELIPNSFAFPEGADGHRKMDRFEAVYFSFMTLTTVGYGDVAPISNTVRMLAMMEATAGAFYLAVLVARLVSLYSKHEPPQSTAAPNRPASPT